MLNGIMQSVANKPFMLGVFMLGVFMLSVINYHRISCRLSFKIYVISCRIFWLIWQTCLKQLVLLLHPYLTLSTVSQGKTTVLAPSPFIF